MTKEMMQAVPEDVLRALNRVEETIQVWKAAVMAVQESGADTMSIAPGPFRLDPIPGPAPPFTACKPSELLEVRPRSSGFNFDIEIYTQQISGLFMGLYFGLLHDQGGDLSS